MSKRPRRNHSPAFKAKVALAAVKREKTLAELAQQLGVSRGSLYYLPRFMLDADLSVMRLIDELHLLDAFAGNRILRDLLRHEGSAVVWPHVATLVKRMGMEALYRRPNTSKPAPGAQGLSLPAAQAGGRTPDRIYFDQPLLAAA